MDKSLLTIDETDALICGASPEDGAIEDREVTGTQVKYFFESDRIGTVCRRTGAVTIS